MERASCTRLFEGGRNVSGIPTGVLCPLACRRGGVLGLHDAGEIDVFAATLTAAATEVVPTRATIAISPYVNVNFVDGIAGAAWDVIDAVVLVDLAGALFVEPDGSENAGTGFFGNGARMRYNWCRSQKPRFCGLGLGRLQPRRGHVVFTPLLYYNSTVCAALFRRFL